MCITATAVPTDTACRVRAFEPTMYAAINVLPCPGSRACQAPNAIATSRPSSHQSRPLVGEEPRERATFDAGPGRGGSGELAVITGRRRALTRREGRRHGPYVQRAGEQVLWVGAERVADAVRRNARARQRRTVLTDRGDLSPSETIGIVRVGERQGPAGGRRSGDEVSLEPERRQVALSRQQLGAGAPDRQRHRLSVDRERDALDQCRRRRTRPRGELVRRARCRHRRCRCTSISWNVGISAMSTT